MNEKTFEGTFISKYKYPNEECKKFNLPWMAQAYGVYKESHLTPKHYSAIKTEDGIIFIHAKSPYQDEQNIIYKFNRFLLDAWYSFV